MWTPVARAAHAAILIVDNFLTALKIDGVLMPPTVSMTVSAEIKTDNRRVIGYLLSPIAKVSSEALKKR